MAAKSAFIQAILPQNEKRFSYGTVQFIRELLENCLLEKCLILPGIKVTVGHYFDASRSSQATNETTKYQNIVTMDDLVSS